MAYAELHAHSNFSFLDGASHPEELAAEAVRLGLSALALTDHNGLYGVVRFAEVVRRLRGHEVLNDRVVHLTRDTASLVGVAQLPQCAVAGVVDPVQQHAADHDRDGQRHGEQERRVAQLVQWRHHRRLRKPNGDDPRARQVLIGQD